MMFAFRLFSLGFTHKVVYWFFTFLTFSGILTWDDAYVFCELQLVKGPKKKYYRDPKKIFRRGSKKKYYWDQKKVFRGHQSFLGLGVRVGRGFRARVRAGLGVRVGGGRGRGGGVGVGVGTRIVVGIGVGVGVVLAAEIVAAHEKILIA